MMPASRFGVFALILTTCVFGASAGDLKAQQPDDLIFYEGNGCSQDIVFTYNSYFSADDNCKDRGPCKGDNDEARSLRIAKTVKSRARIIVFDSPKGRYDDDYTVIDILNTNFIPPEGYCLRTFHSNFDNPDRNSGIRVEYFQKNGLDGKVSRVRVMPELSP